MQDRPAGLAAQVTRLAVQDGMTAEALLVHAARGEAAGRALVLLHAAARQAQRASDMRANEPHNL